MATTIKMSVLGSDALAKRLDASTVLPKLQQAMKDEMVALADYVRSRKLSGQVLHRRSGDLSRSITGQAELSGSTVRGTMGSKGVPYAGIHEFGASFDREISQAFGHPIVARSVHFTYPERSFLRTSANEQRDRITAALREAATGALHEA